MTVLKGIPISPGLARGTAIVYDFDVGRHLTVSQRDVSTTEVKSEWERLDEALAKSSHDLSLVATSVTAGSPRSASLAILAAHAAMTAEIASLVKQHIESELVNVEQALASVVGDWVERLTRLDSEYLRQREQDIRDVGRRMSRYLAGSLAWNKGPLPLGSIVVARELLPSEAIELANCGVVGIVTERGGHYSHTAIIARSLGIPAVSRVLHATSLIHPGMSLLLDGDEGVVTESPSKAQGVDFAERQRRRELEVANLWDDAGEPSVTTDGVEITLVGNVGRPEEIASVLKSKLSGVGLFRTEFLFLEAAERPSTDTQAEVYGGMASCLGGLPMVVRTFDLGGDKQPPFLFTEGSEQDANLFVRGLRFSLAEGRLFESQIRAILKVTRTADLRILLPMVVGLDGFARAVAVIERIAVECGLPRTPPIGAMIETPASLYALDQILDLADFVAIGTNDLTQYMLATERGLADKSEDCSAMHPAVLQAIRQIVAAGVRLQCPVSVCGEEAGNPDFACLLVGLGIRELSLSPSQAGVVRQAIRAIDSKSAQAIAEQAIACGNTSDVRALVARWRSGATESPDGAAGSPAVVVADH
ncbi:Phosphoenolpyruvate-protein phosphotransferase [Posidoniimonas polymericola]|uniref:Phosphoenolpyruvate-protein phosphotransferase n=1 Tax=Posidoniimonas polymericola TaxID=2528002 RepID=A0A5C5ZDR5_9BACT|nr:phosphoenolpyruvate--protein phosphotransferase [Posidoniimonas polymericola]TWT85286.1 Phosphoenolpyruvate-protein phosphotransferase [Posidoniimonas polymericola]